MEEKLLEAMHTQERLLRKQLMHSRIRSVCAVVVVVAVLLLARAGIATLRDVQALTHTASYTVSQMSQSFEALRLQETVDAVNTLLADSSTQIEQSLAGISSIDFKKLANSIDALEAASTSIGRVFGYNAGT